MVAACILATCTTNPPGTTTPTEPDGISNIKLGMTTAAFEKLYGAAVTERILPPTPGEPTPPYVMLSYRINGQTIDALQGCSISASFLNDFLYEVQATCQEPKPKIEAYLAKRFGAPDYDETPFKFWNHEHTSVNYNSTTGAFMVEDKKQSQSASWGRMAIRKSRLKDQPAGTPTPLGNR